MRNFGLLLGIMFLSACADRSFTPVMPDALNVGSPVTILAATTRAKNLDGSYGFDRSEKLSLLELTISIPPTHTPGDLNYAYANPRPETQFTLAGQVELASPAAFQNRVRQEMAKKSGRETEVTVYIHGYNATQAETAFRAAQLANDVKLPGAQVIYSWPSRGKSLGYAYDFDSALFARDGLEKLLFQLKATGARRIILVAHSMGGLVMMETLRQIERRRPGWVGTNIGGVVMISPDLDIELFRTQMKSLSHIPQPFVVFVSRQDSILNLSSRLRGRGEEKRLGNIENNDQIADLPVDVIDTTAFSKDAASPHFVIGSSPALIAMFGDVQALQDTFDLDPSAALASVTAAHQSGINQSTREVLVLPGDSPR
jgi:esterase/lipase superfamily enzyme